MLSIVNKSTITTNPLLRKYQYIPFKTISLSDYKPAIEQSIEMAKKQIEEIIANDQQPEFDNTIRKFEFSSFELDYVYNLLNNQNRADTNVEVQALSKEISPIITSYKNGVQLNKKLFEKINSVYERKEELNLNPEQMSLLQKKYNLFINNGALLPDIEAQRLSQINIEIAELILKFEENLLADKSLFKLNITDESDLKGLPEGSKEAAKMLAKAQGLEGWLFTIDDPSYLPFVTYIEKRELRKQISIAYGSKCYQNNKNDNQEIVIKIAQLRKEKANLLNFKSYADFILKDRMARMPELVHQFLQKIVKKAIPFAEKEFEDLSEFAKLDGIENLERWDVAYYSEKLKKKIFDLDNEELRPYFKLDNVINGMFTIANKLFGLIFKENDYMDKYHDEVKSYKVYGAHGYEISTFFIDAHTRPGKQNGGWVYSFKPQYKTSEGINERPQVGIFCNFQRSTETKPALLTFSDVTTIFHEFGHALHSMVTDVSYPSISGINVIWDFLEVPSQLMENWCYEEEALTLFAKHYETGEIIPIDFINKIKAAQNFNTGLNTIRQINYSCLDLKWHSEEFPLVKEDIKKAEKECMIDFFPHMETSCAITSFLHLFNCTYDYSAGYYTYMWAELIDAHAFYLFKDNGIFCKKTGESYMKNILERGGSEDAMTLYKRFRGHEPTEDAFLKRRGLKD